MTLHRPRRGALHPRSLLTMPTAPPKLRVPLRLEGGRLGVCDQDSEENVAACVASILSYERGSRVEDVEFGVEDPTFETLPLDLREWLEQIARYEPRARIGTWQEIEETVGLVGVKVGPRR